MKKILESFNKLAPESIEEIKSILELKKAGEKTIISRMLTLSGVEALIETLSPEEQTLASAVYRSPSGITFTELEKETGIPSQTIEKLADSLAARALLYVLKNRQLLNNKLDKIYGIQEFSDLIKPAGDDEILENLSIIKNRLLEVQSRPPQKKQDFPEKENDLFNYIIESGYIVLLSDLRQNFGNCDQLLTSLSDRGYLSIYFNFTKGFRIYISIRHEKAMSILSSMQSEKRYSLNNRFMFINNMLYAADVISGYGLFLTQQNEFRKIDMRRVVDSMILLLDSSGIPADGDRITLVTLGSLYILGCLEIRRDAVAINLKPLKKDLYNPANIISKILKRLEFFTEDELPAAISFDVPENESVNSLISLADSNPGLSAAVMGTIAQMEIMIENPDNLVEAVSQSKSRKSSLRSAQDLLSFLGIFRIESGKVFLNENHFIDDETAGNLKPSEEKQSVYVSPDFSVIIPAEDITPFSLYIILSYVEIEKFDVIIHARITKGAVVNAYKRGMPVKRFLETLKVCSKSDLPQNMDFLLNEWINQIVEIEITNRYLLQANHASFIDELTHARAGSGVIERISDVYVIIDRQYLDEIIKFARKKDVLISLFKTGEADESTG